MTINRTLPYTVTVQVSIRWQNPDVEYSYGDYVAEGESTVRLADLRPRRIENILTAFTETVSDAFERAEENAMTLRADTEREREQAEIAISEIAASGE